MGCVVGSLPEDRGGALTGSLTDGHARLYHDCRALATVVHVVLLLAAITPDMMGAKGGKPQGQGALAVIHRVTETAPKCDAL